MAVIGIRELRQHASRYLAQVEAGEEVSITNRGRTGAKLVPVSADERSRESLIEAGVLVPSRTPQRLRAIDPDALPSRDLSATLDSIRDER